MLAKSSASSDGDDGGRSSVETGTTDDGETEVSEQARPSEHDTVEARLDDALERVAHGATVSIPSILVQNALSVAFTAVLTNGFTASAYGLFALARRFQQYASNLSSGFMTGLSRYIPSADSTAERELIATFASALLLGVAAVFGATLYVAAPTITRLTGESDQFLRFLRIFAAGTPAVVWLSTVGSMFRAFEEVGAMNATTRIGGPLAELLVAVAGTLLLDDLVAVAVGVVGIRALVGLVGAAWLANEKGLRPRLRGPDAVALHRKYLRYSIPLFFAGFATVTQRLGFYPLIAWFLSGTAGGVFAVGVLVGGLVRLPLTGINQFISPVIASLHDDGHRDALARLYHVTSRLVLFGITPLATPAVVFRREVMAVFGPTFVEFASLLPGFIVAQYVACAAGSVGMLLMMTDHQRTLLVVNVVATAVLVVTAIPLTASYGLAGLVVSYLLMNTVNNGLEVVALYRLEGLQPLTRRHANPLVAAVPLAAVALAVRATLPGTVAAVVGSLLGLVVYAGTLRLLGFTRTERRLGSTLSSRYRTALRDALQ